MTKAWGEYEMRRSEICEQSGATYKTSRKGPGNKTNNAPNEHADILIRRRRDQGSTHHFRKELVTLFKKCMTPPLNRFSTNTGYLLEELLTMPSQSLFSRLAMGSAI